MAQLRTRRARRAGGEPHGGPLLRAAYEGAAFTALEGLEAARAAGARVDSVVLAGGLAQRRELVQLRSTIWQLPVRFIPGVEATTTGAAALAGIAAGVFGDGREALGALLHQAETVMPERVDAATVDAARRRWAAAGALARSSLSA